MRLRIEKSTANGSICAPPSKSELHRAILCAALSGGVTKMTGFSPSEDIYATLRAIKAIGADFSASDNVLSVTGTCGSIFCPAETIDCVECGSALRFIIPIIAAGTGGILTGSPKLMSRPLSVYEAVFAEKGIDFSLNDGILTVGGGLTAGNYIIPGDVSSQFVSGLLFALPLLPGDSRIIVTGRIESRPYIDMTIKMLERFGINVSEEHPGTFTIKGSQIYKSPGCFHVPGDWSNAAALLAFNEIGGCLEISGLDTGSTQGDKVCPELFERLRGEAPQIDISDSPDLGPVLMALAAAENGALLTGTSRLRLKESDRGEAMKEELKAFGVPVEIGENTIRVGSGLKAPARPVDSHNDHRIAMALSLLLSITGGELTDAQAINKSYPGFYDRLRDAGVLIYEA